MERSRTIRYYKRGRFWQGRTEVLTEELKYWQKNWSTDRRTEVLTEELKHWQKNWSTDRRTEVLTEELKYRQKNWSTDRRTEVLTEELKYWQKNWSTDRRTEVLTEELVTEPLCPPQILPEIALDCSRVSMFRHRRPTASFVTKLITFIVTKQTSLDLIIVYNSN